MTTYSYAELEGLWISQGGPRAVAPVAAAIAEAESGGNSDEFNPKDSNGRGGTQVSAGLWQISNGTMTPVKNWANPAVNARYAVQKWQGAGKSFSPWGTFTDGSYKAFLSSKTTPATNISGSQTQQTAQAVVASAATCLIPDPLASVSVPIIGSLSLGPACILSKSQARAVMGAGILLLGGLVTWLGVSLFVAGVEGPKILRVVIGTVSPVRGARALRAAAGPAGPTKEEVTEAA